MSTARKILDLHGQDVTELARELAHVPQGRYVLVPEDDLEDAEELVLPDDELAKLARAFEDADRNHTIPASEVYARLTAKRKARRTEGAP